jgi:uncharacterized RDD family membrane protein YckC
MMSIIPMIVVLLIVVAGVVWFKRRKKNDELMLQKERRTTFPRVIFGCFLILVGIASLGSVSKQYQTNFASFFSTIFTSLIIVTGGIRILTISKPTIDADGTVYADFGKRFWANAIDGILLLAGFYMVHLAFDKISLISYIVVTSLFTLAAQIFVVWMISKYHATPGKMLIGLIVKTVEKKSVSIRHALLRSSVDIGFALLYGIAFLISLKTFSYSEFRELKMLKGMTYATSHFPIWHTYATALSQLWFWSELAFLMFNKKRRAIHDFIAGTIVIEKPKA